MKGSHLQLGWLIFNEAALTKFCHAIPNVGRVVCTNGQVFTFPEALLFGGTLYIFLKSNVVNCGPVVGVSERKGFPRRRLNESN